MEDGEYARIRPTRARAVIFKVRGLSAYNPEKL